MNIIVIIKYLWEYIENFKLYSKFVRLYNIIFISIKSILINLSSLIEFHGYNKYFIHNGFLSHRLSFEYKIFKINVYLLLQNCNRKKINFFF